MGYYNIVPDNTKSERELLSEIFRAAWHRGTGNTGMFGLRLQRPSADFFMHELRELAICSASDHERIREVFGRTRFIHLTRKKKLEQAISYVKATQTGLWHQPINGTELERLSAAKNPVYDAEAIQRHLREMTRMDEQWESWFADEGLDPLRINYEDLSHNLLAVTGHVLEYLGLNRELASNLELPTARLADKTNSDWASRFRRNNLS